MSKRKKRAIIISAVSLPLAFLFIFMPLSTVIIYESIFGARYETEEWIEYSVEDFDGLNVEKSDFVSDNTKLAGYKYKKTIETIKGVVVIAHGLGGGGHNSYMPFVDFFTDNGYFVFAYDAHGNDGSEGDSVEGLPRGLIDLDNAINHVKSLEEYNDLPILLLGHSWGAYAVANVLEYHPDVKAAVIIAGYNESEDMLDHHARPYAGFTVDFSMIYLDVYERLKFGGKYTDITATEAISGCETEIMVVHGGLDTTVPPKYGYDKLYSKFYASERVEFRFFDNRAHDDIFCSDDAIAYRREIDLEYEKYLKTSGKIDNETTKNQFMQQTVNKEKYFELDPDLMSDILVMFDTCCIQ